MFNDRIEAGRKLADHLQDMRLPHPVVLALPRGGVPVAAQVARRLGAPIGLILVRKIGVPGHEELAAGAVAEGAEPVFNAEVLASIGKKPADFAAAVKARRAEIAARRTAYLGERPDPDVAGATAIVIDDGIATGATLRAALLALRDRGPARLILAVPVAPTEARAAFAPLADDIVILEEPPLFMAVGAYYRDFRQTEDAEVIAALAGQGTPTKPHG